MPPSPPLMDIAKLKWETLKCLKSELRLDTVLQCGQSFRWKKLNDDAWVGVIEDQCFVLSQDDFQLMFKSFPKQPVDKDIATLKDYFQLNVELTPLYKEWAKVDPVFEKICTSYPGIRMLRQDPAENLFSFICSSNNNIQRISSMVENLCIQYGNRICQVQHGSDIRDIYAFPSVQTMSKDLTGLEKKLRTLGFGYRAAYIAKTAKQIQAKGGKDYLQSLRNLEYDQARQELLQFSGIGPKVADCILLMSLEQPSAIPVDTHMFQIAARQYLPHLKQYKSVTDKVYKEIGDHFRKLYGPYAGWAHSVLFSADLKHLKTEISSTEKTRKRSNVSETPKTQDSKKGKAKRKR